MEVGIPLSSWERDSGHPSGLIPIDGAADGGSMHWTSLVMVVLLGWLGVALAVGTLVGHGISLGAERDSR